MKIYLFLFILFIYQSYSYQICRRLDTKDNIYHHTAVTGSTCKYNTEIWQYGTTAKPKEFFIVDKNYEKEVAFHIDNVEQRIMLGTEEKTFNCNDIIKLILGGGKYAILWRDLITP